MKTLLITSKPSIKYSFNYQYSKKNIIDIL